MAVTGTITVEAVLNYVNALDLSAEAKAGLSKILRATFASGVGLNQIDRVFWDERTIAGSATDSLDLAGGGLVDPLGVAFAPARIKVLIVNNLGPNTINLQRPAANGAAVFLAASDGVAIPSGGFACFVWPDATGIAVTAGTADLINIVNTAGGNTVVQVIIGGASA